MKPPCYPTLWEACVNAIVFQQLSIRQPGAIMRRLIMALEQRVERDLFAPSSIRVSRSGKVSGSKRRYSACNRAKQAKWERCGALRKGSYQVHSKQKNWKKSPQWGCYGSALQNQGNCPGRQRSSCFVAWAGSMCFPRMTAAS